MRSDRQLDMHRLWIRAKPWNVFQERWSDLFENRRSSSRAKSGGLKISYSSRVIFALKIALLRCYCERRACRAVFCGMIPSWTRHTINASSAAHCYLDFVEAKHDVSLHHDGATEKCVKWIRNRFPFTATVFEVMPNFNNGIIVFG